MINMINIILIILGVIIVGFILLYQIIKYKCTEYKYKKVAVLKDETNPHKSFNLIGNIPGLCGEEVFIQETSKYVFNKVVETKFTIEQSTYDSDDDYDGY